MPHLLKCHSWVVCKINSGDMIQSTKFTFGKSYEILSWDTMNDNTVYILTDDSGRYVSYELYKHCFMSVEESRDFKLNDILN